MRGMDLGEVGVWSAGLRRHEDRAEVAEAARELEALGYGALWFPGSAGGPVLDVAAELLDATGKVVVATGILNVWGHDPAEVAAGFAGLEENWPGRFLLGLGVGHPSNAPDYRRPLAKMRSFLDALESVPREARVLAALRPRMLELARARSAGAHPYFVPVEHTRRAREALGPRLLAPEQAVVLESDPGRARAIARAHVERYLGLPNYVNNLRWLGFTEDDLRGSDRLVDAVVAWGDEAAIAVRVREHLAAGADHVCIQVLNGGLPRAEWRRLAPALVGVGSAQGSGAPVGPRNRSPRPTDTPP